MKASELTPQNLSKQFPNLEFNVSGGVFFPEDAHLHPGELLASLYKQLKQENVEFIENTQITGVQTQKGRIAKILSGETTYEVEELVLAMGSWSPLLAKQLDLDIPIQAGKGYSITLDNSLDLNSPVVLNDAAIAITPFKNQMRYAGTMEFSGVELSINPNRVEGMLNSIKSFIPSFETKGIDRELVWAGLRPCSADGMPLIGRVNNYSNLLLAAGHAMLGLTLAPVTGKIIANIVAGKNDHLSPCIAVNRFE